MLASELTKIANERNEKRGQSFWNEFKETLFAKMKRNAECGNEALKFNKKDEELNLYGWLEVPYLYNSVIKELENLGYTVTHSDDVKDGIYMIIKWGF